MHFCLRTLPVLTGCILASLGGGFAIGGERDSAAKSPESAAKAAGQSLAGGSSLFTWLPKTLTSAVSTPMGDEQQKQLFSSLLDHMRVHVSARLLDRLTQQSLDREFPIEDAILGVEFAGRAKSTSTMRVQLAPDDERAVFEVVLAGVVKSQTIGKAGPVRLHCQGVTRFTASKRFHLTDEGLIALPVQCKAETTSTVTDITSDLPGLRGRVATRIAWRRSEQTHDEAERISAEHHEASISRLFDEEMSRLEAAVETALANEFLRGGSGNHPQRRRFHFHTSRDYLCIASSCGKEQGPLPPEPKADTLAKLWLPTALIDLPLALNALQAAQSRSPDQLWRELTGREWRPLASQAKAPASVANANRPEPPVAVNVGLENGWLSLSMQPR